MHHRASGINAQLGRVVRILSIDGGGYLGLATASFLNAIEQRYDARAADRFDLFCGTSTGAIIALALAKGMSAAEVVALYEELGPQVFRKWPWHERVVPRLRTLRAVAGALHDNTPLTAALTKAFGTMTLGDLRQGRIVVERPDVIVETVTVPSVDDRRSRFTFFRARKPTQAAINAAWKASGGTQNYLGEWHTHPEDHPTPSWVDRRDWQRIAREARFEQDALFFLIVGRVSIAAWEVPRGGGPEVLLTRRSADDV
jgi:integrative and conjugative element protein (TIGR02256 family)